MKHMKMQDDRREEGLVEQTIPYGSEDFDYDDVTEEMYDEEEEAEFDRELAEMAAGKVKEMENMKRHDVLAEAVNFAVEKHKGTNRKGTDIPYIVHPMEAAAIAAGMTDDVEVIAAAVLHDTVEDTDATKKDILEKFGERVAELVAAESEDKMDDRPEAETWQLRKKDTIRHLRECTDRDVKIVALADKLSNVRALHRDYMALGDRLWERFNQKDPAMQKWYYESLGETFAELKGTQAYMEYSDLLVKVFGHIQ